MLAFFLFCTFLSVLSECHIMSGWAEYESIKVSRKLKRTTSFQLLWLSSVAGSVSQSSNIVAVLPLSSLSGVLQSCLGYVMVHRYFPQRSCKRKVRNCDLCIMLLTLVCPWSLGSQVFCTYKTAGGVTDPTPGQCCPRRRRRQQTLLEQLLSG